MLIKTSEQANPNQLIVSEPNFGGRNNRNSFNTGHQMSRVNNNNETEGSEIDSRNIYQMDLDERSKSNASYQ